VWLADATSRTPIDVATLVSPVIFLTSSVAIGDVAVDTYALEQELPGRALYQVLGLLLGRLFSTSVSFSLQLEPLHIVGAVLVAEVVAFVTLLSCWRRDFRELRFQRHRKEKEDANSTTGALLQRTANFVTRRPNMLWWLLHSLVPPVMYFHVLSVLWPRMEQRGLSQVDIAGWWEYAFTVPVILAAFAGDVVARCRRAGPLFAVYGMQAAVCGYVLWLYTSFDATPAHPVVFSLLGKVQDALFYVFEVTEFEYYGEVAQLDPRIAATLITMQASVFNLADFLHTSTSLQLTDALSDGCKRGEDDGLLRCVVDGYPVVGVASTTIGILWMLVSWSKVSRCMDVMDAGWRPNQERSFITVILAICLVLLLCVYTVHNVNAVL